MRTAFEVLSVYVAVVGWLFVVLYAPRLWRRSRGSAAGWNALVLTGTLAAAFTVLAVGGAGAWRAWVWLAITVLIAAAITHRLILLGARDKAPR